MPALNIKNAEAHRLAREIAEATGDSVTGAVMAALREKKAAIDASRKPDPKLVEELLDWGRRFRAELEARGLPIPRSSDHDDLYDEWGLPK